MWLYVKKKTLIDVKFIDFSYLTFHPNIVKDRNKFLRYERKKNFYILSSSFNKNILADLGE